MDISQCGVVAQSVEQQPFKLVVLGSIPSYPRGFLKGTFLFFKKFFGLEKKQITIISLFYISLFLNL